MNACAYTRVCAHHGNRRRNHTPLYVSQHEIAAYNPPTEETQEHTRYTRDIGDHPT
jgi:hypothetical protein